MKKIAIKKIHLLPNVVTAFGLSCGLFVIFKMNMTPLGTVDYPFLAAISGILLLAAFADLIDGALARAMKAESEFGGLFDSLADAISFGVSPSVIILKSLSISPTTEPFFALITAAMVFSLCGVMRLVRFNILAQKAKEDLSLITANKKNFTGLPIPAAAAAAVSAVLFLVFAQEEKWFNISSKTQGWIMFCALILLGYFMISRWKFFSFKALQIRVASFQLVFLTVIFAIVIFYGVLNYFPIVFLLVTWGYVFVAWALSVIRIIACRKSHTLEDFEPEEEETEEDEVVIEEEEEEEQVH